MEDEVTNSNSNGSSLGTVTASRPPQVPVSPRTSLWPPSSAVTTIFFSFTVIIIVSGIFISGFDVVAFKSKLPSSFTTSGTDSGKSPTSGSSSSSNTSSSSSLPNSKGPRHQYPLNCSTAAPQQCSPSHYPTSPIPPDSNDTTSCPDYFRWIHEDLRPWRASGITREAIESRRSLAHFRLVVYKGKAYLEQFHRAWQTRDVFTLWGILQLLRVFPGRVPDLEMMFCCEDLPAILKRDNKVPDGVAPPAMFHYCGHDSAFDIPFPDWSFWGWPEVNIRPWATALKAIRGGAGKMEWKDRDPHAFWKGNPTTSQLRGKLMHCKPDKSKDWNARLYVVDWGRESSTGFNESKLEDQCTHRYDIYVEGRSWSVSQKYILGCDATTLVIRREYYDFFSRGMIPMEHYWPVGVDNMCQDIKFAVDWGNQHRAEAQKMGEEGARFAEESLSMKRVYDYMFHLLDEYAKLQRFEATVPAGAVEICAETMACHEAGLVKEYMTETLVTTPSNELPCSMLPPYDPHELQEYMRRKESISKQVEAREAEYQNRIRKKAYFDIFVYMSFFLLLAFFVSRFFFMEPRNEL